MDEGELKAIVEREKAMAAMPTEFDDSWIAGLLARENEIVVQAGRDIRALVAEVRRLRTRNAGLEAALSEMIKAGEALEEELRGGVNGYQ